jgi:hypothetical protein
MELLFTLIIGSYVLSSTDHHYFNISHSLLNDYLNFVVVVVVRRHHFDALFLINVFSGTKYCPSVWKQLAFVFPLGTYVTLPRSVAPSATALQQDVHLLQMQFVNLQISLVSHV